MKPAGHFTAVLLLAAFGAVGCSKGDDKSETSVGPPASAQTRPVATTTPPATLKPSDEAPAASVAPKVTGSFADGEAAYQAKRYGDAMAIFEAYTEHRPGNAWGHYMLGLSAWKSDDPAKAGKAFDKVLSIDPRHVKSLVNSSRVFIEQKRHDDAIERLSRAAEIAPGSAEVYRLLGRTYHAQGRTDRAIDAYRHAIELNDRDAWSMNNLGLLFLEAQRAEDAVPLLARAVELRKEVPEFHNNLGMALEHTGRFKAAATAYGGALAADPGYDKAKQNLSRVEAVKSGPETKFELDAPATASGEDVDVPRAEKTATN